MTNRKFHKANVFIKKQAQIHTMKKRELHRQDTNEPKDTTKNGDEKRDWRQKRLQM